MYGYFAFCNKVPVKYTIWSDHAIKQMFSSFKQQVELLFWSDHDSEQILEVLNIR